MSNNPTPVTANQLLSHELVLLRQYAQGALTLNQQVHERLVSNLLLSDRRFGGMFGADKPGRDIDLECGYPRHEFRPSDYKALYDRVGLANRAVKVYPVECWSVYPQLYETDDQRVTKFERAWKELEFRHRPWSHLQRLDVLAGIGRFAVMVLGLPGKTEEPPPGVRADGRRAEGFEKKEPWQDLAYLQCYDQTAVRVKKLDRDPASPRCGLPLSYTVTVTHPSYDDLEDSSRQFTDYEVHWTRVIHFADNVEDERAFGVPRLRAVLNFILDCRKVAGADAEGYWQTGFPGYSVETLPNLVEDGEMDTASAEEQWRRYRDELRRVMFMHGTTVKSLAPTVSDPTPHLVQPLQLMCATLSVPVRVFLGSEAAHLASTQDIQTWNRRLGHRQKNVIEPDLIQPFVERLVLVGVLPAPKGSRFVTEWRDLNAVSDEVRADIALKKSQGLMQYVTGKGYEVMRPYHYLTLVMGYSESEAGAVIAACGGEDKMIEKLQAIAKAELVPAGGARTGNAPKASPGRPAGKTP